jgi:hypothetical protein
MSIEDEIQAKKEKMQADIREQELRKQEALRLSTALRKAGMEQSYPVLIVPASELQPIITETMPSMRFCNPKIVRSMPDGRTLARYARNDERPDMFSFDVQLFSNRTYELTIYRMWIFKNGAISFNDNNMNNLTWADVRSKGIDATTVRAKIIEALASQAIQDEKDQQESGGCYIATAVYGSYDCPEVWVLRRYRDYALKNSVLGRLFIRIYYAVSPKLVKWFGKKVWFRLLWHNFLDKKVAVLKEAGYSDKEYKD